MAAKEPGVVFDLDGTLVDSNYLHVVAWTRAFAESGCWAPMAAIHRMVGVGSSLLVKEVLGDDAPVEQIAEAHGRHFDRLKPELRAFPEARELLEDVAGRGALAVLATSSRQEDVDALIATFGPTDAVAATTSGADVEEAKPEPDVLVAAMEKGGVDPARAVLVGDSVWDIEAARRAGIPCVAVLTGGTSRAELEEAGAAAVYRDVADIRAHLDRSPLGAVLPS
jgi:HAD superfamily hydrolase (TIGR01509 family)